ncbi:MAG TPA: UDP-N-acetylmuramyl-tripeptide synthetase [Candidatus Paceibacterota bacterium]|nr:UDP-N-acetylmuramyl-tripeptide synthetase [Candidatus Paceibacterota bacterium]
MQALRSILQRILPRSLYRALLRPYHLLFAFLAALRYGFPAKDMTVIAVTGTKGKSSVTEMLFHVLSYAGLPAAVAGTISFKILNEEKPNLFKMTMPGRGFIQRFLREASDKGAKYAVIEVTSEATLQFRHYFLSLDALIFTNLQKEHIESHGSFENYARAKLSIGTALARSVKRPRAIIANADTVHSEPYLELPVEEKLPFSYIDAYDVELGPGTATFSYKDARFTLQLPGGFSIMNALAVIKAAEFLGVPLPKIAEALSDLKRIPGRTERIDVGQDFQVVVDYAHTPDSLEALYGAYPNRKICVLGNTGGGRDTWKRPSMGAIADKACDIVILTDEDPYDEDPMKIVHEMAKGMERTPKIIMDRREAIRAAIAEASTGDSVLITGKGTDPYIMRANGQKEPWSDAQVVREELAKLLGK